ncbi:MAG: MFS transporter [Pseudomonadota bacterium]
MTQEQKFSTDRFALKLGLFYAAYFLYGGIQLPFFPLWLESRGLSAREIGFVIAVPMVVRIVFTPFIGHQADRRSALKSTLVIASGAGCLAMAVVGLVQGFVAIMATVIIAAVAYAPLLSLSDAYALNGLRVRGRAYGPVRLWGSVSFIVGNIGAGYLLGFIEPGQLIWLVVFGLFVTFLAATALVPLEPNAPRSETISHSPRSLWRNPAFVLVVAAVSLTQSSHAFYYGFSTLEWRAAGVSGTVIGVLWGIGVVAEVILFAVSARLPSALAPTLMIALGAGGAVVRWTAMAFEPPSGWLLAIQILHAASFAATHIGAMAFLARAVPRELSATAQGTLATAGGILTASATGLSGLIYATSGSLTYLVMAAMACVGGTCALVAHRIQRD